MTYELLNRIEQQGMEEASAKFGAATKAAEAAAIAWATSPLLREQYRGDQQAFVQQAIAAAGGAAFTPQTMPDQPGIAGLAKVMEVLV